LPFNLFYLFFIFDFLLFIFYFFVFGLSFQKQIKINKSKGLIRQKKNEKDKENSINKEEHVRIIPPASFVLSSTLFPFRVRSEFNQKEKNKKKEKKNGEKKNSKIQENLEINYKNTAIKPIKSIVKTLLLIFLKTYSYTIFLHSFYSKINQLN